MKSFIFSLFTLLLLAAPVSAQDIYVVSFGVANYPNVTKLTKAEEDAKAIAEIYKHKTSNVILYTGRFADRASILRATKDQFSHAKEGDMIVFAFSGHGYQGGICPYDVTETGKNNIKYDEILAIMQKSKATKKVLLIDACYSGGFRTGSSHKHQSSEAKINKTDVVMFLASRTNETSKESKFMTNGFFTHYLVNGLKGNADANRDRIVTARELFDFISTNVIERSGEKQHPVAWGKFSDDFPMMDWR